MTPEQHLATHDIPYTLHEHPAVFTCEEADKYCGDIPGLPCKNLFLKGKKTKEYFLIILPATSRADLKKIGEIVGDKVSFASPEALKEKLDLTPGAVSPFGLINDNTHQIKLYIDQKVHNAEIVNFHPNRNTASLELSKEGFHKFLGTLENPMKVFEN